MIRSRLALHKRLRHDWEKEFSAMAENGDDKLLDEEAINLSEWDKNEWEW